MTLEQARALALKKITAELGDDEESQAVVVLATAAFDALLDIAASLRKIAGRADPA